MKNFKFSTLEYKRPDLEARRAQLAAWKDAVERAENYDALRELLFEIDRVNCELFTQYSVAHIRHTLDTRDEFYEAEISYLQDTLPTLGGAEVALSEAIASADSARISRENSARSILYPQICRRSFTARQIFLFVSRKAA